MLLKRPVNPNSSTLNNIMSDAVLCLLELSWIEDEIFALGSSKVFFRKHTLYVKVFIGR